MAEDIVDRLAGNIMQQIRSMINARLAVIEQRLPPEPSLRPPLGQKKYETPRSDPKMTAKVDTSKPATYALVAATAIKTKATPEKEKKRELHKS